MSDGASWQWFLAASAAGSWIVTEGVARVLIDHGKITAELRFSDDVAPYLRIRGAIDDDGAVEATGVSADPQVEDLDLRGSYSVAELDGGAIVESMLLGDGWTSVGLTRQRERRTQ
jgi:hypothetical protein